MQASQQCLSGSANGAPILVAATTLNGSATLIHTATSSTTGFDRVRLFVSNTHTAPVTVTVGWGGTTDPNHLIVDSFSIPQNTPPIEIVPPLPLNNSLVVRAAASVADKLLITGDVIRVLP